MPPSPATLSHTTASSLRFQITFEPTRTGFTCPAWHLGLDGATWDTNAASHRHIAQALRARIAAWKASGHAPATVVHRCRLTAPGIDRPDLSLGTLRSLNKPRERALRAALRGILGGALDETVDAQVIRQAALHAVSRLRTPVAARLTVEGEVAPAPRSAWPISFSHRQVAQSIQTIVPLQGHHFAPAAELCTRAFCDWKVGDLIERDAAQRPAVLKRYFDFIFPQVIGTGGQGSVVQDADGVVRAVSLWQWRERSCAMRRYAKAGSMQTLRNAIGRERLGLLMHHGDHMSEVVDPILAERSGPRLKWLAVDPPEQGAGLGALLMQETLGAYPNETWYLTTDTVPDYYLRFGFQRVESATYTVHNPHGQQRTVSIPFVVMRRNLAA